MKLVSHFSPRWKVGNTEHYSFFTNDISGSFAYNEKQNRFYLTICDKRVRLYSEEEVPKKWQPLFNELMNLWKKRKSPIQNERS